MTNLYRHPNPHYFKQKGEKQLNNLKKEEMGVAQWSMKRIENPEVSGSKPSEDENTR